MARCVHGLTDCQSCGELETARAACARVLVKLKTLDVGREIPIPAQAAPDEPSTARPMDWRVSRDQPLPMALTKPSHGGDSSIPRGVSEAAIRPGCPAKHISLYAHYRWRMGAPLRRGDVTELLMLVGAAARDYELAVNPYGGPWRIGSEQEALTFLLERLRGTSAEEAAGWLAGSNQSLASAARWVRVMRTQHAYDADSGEPLEQSDTLASVASLRLQGLSVRKIATELGLSKSTVDRMLARGRA